MFEDIFDAVVAVLTYGFFIQIVTALSITFFLVRKRIVGRVVGTHLKTKHLDWEAVLNAKKLVSPQNGPGTFSDGAIEIIETIIQQFHLSLDNDQKEIKEHAERNGAVLVRSIVYLNSGIGNIDLYVAIDWLKQQFYLMYGVEATVGKGINRNHCEVNIFTSTGADVSYLTRDPNMITTVNKMKDRGLFEKDDSCMLVIHLSIVSPLASINYSHTRFTS